VANSAPDDAQLEQLLTQLLRVVSPAFAAAHSEAGPGAVDGRTADAAQKEAYALDGHASASDPAGTEAAKLASILGSGAAKLPSVSGSEARALIELVSARGIAQGELAGLLGLDKSTVSRLAAGLERKGWIRRGRDEDNQRYVRLYLTETGAEIAARVLQAWNSRQARILAALSDEERAGLSAGLRGLVRGLSAEGLLASQDR